MYLWLNAEGWVRFGPFEFLRFADEPRVIQDQSYGFVATWDGSGWLAAESRYSRYRFRDPMVTVTPWHPHPMHG